MLVNVTVLDEPVPETETFASKPFVITFLAGKYIDDNAVSSSKYTFIDNDAPLSTVNPDLIPEIVTVGIVVSSAAKT